MTVKAELVFFELVNDWILSRPGDDKLDLFVDFSLLQVLGPPLVQLRIYLRIDHWFLQNKLMIILVSTTY